MGASRIAAAAFALALLAASCGGADDGAAPAEPQAASSSPAVTTGDPLASPSVDGSFAVSDGRKLALRCYGEGSPTVVLDAGSGDAGIGAYQGSPVLEGLADQTQVCTYDRAGLGASDPAPERKRNLDDAASDLHDLLAAAGISGPFVLVGSSGGGFNVFHHAGRYPREVAGLVLLDVPAGQPDLTPADVGGPWNGPGNPERMDYVAIERTMALDRLPIPPIPVTVVTASGGQSADPDEQRVWLEGSSDPSQVVLDGGHEIYLDDPDGVLAEIVSVLETVRGGA
jgi:pimeloyl-ACP methyl ester carboxylesterase